MGLGERGVPESRLKSVKQDDAEVQMLREIAADPKTPTHLRLGALNSLHKLKEAAEPEPTPDPLGQMRGVIEKYAPEVQGMEDAPPDPMRDLDFQAIVGRKANPVLWEWCSYCPSEPQRAERAVVAAVRRLGMAQGPYGPPDGDELAQRRRTRRSG